MRTTSPLSVAATARAVNQWQPSLVLIVPPSGSTEANRKSPLTTEANGRSGAGLSLAAGVPQCSLGLPLRYPGAEVAAPLQPRSWRPRPYLSPLFKLSAPQPPERPPRSRVWHPLFGGQTPRPRGQKVRRRAPRPR